MSASSTSTARNRNNHLPQCPLRPGALEPGWQTPLAFVSFDGKYPQLFVVPAQLGGEPQQLTRLDGAVYFVQWKPVP